MTKQTYSWQCPQCERTFKIRNGTPAPDVCPDCRADDSGLPNFVPSYSSRHRSAAKGPGASFLGALCFAFGGLSAAMGLVAASEAHQQGLGTMAGLSALFSGLSDAVLLFAVGTVIQLLLRRD